MQTRPVFRSFEFAIKWELLSAPELEAVGHDAIELVRASTTNEEFAEQKRSRPMRTTLSCKCSRQMRVKRSINGSAVHNCRLVVPAMLQQLPNLLDEMDGLIDKREPVPAKHWQFILLLVDMGDFHLTMLRRAPEREQRKNG